MKSKNMFRQLTIEHLIKRLLLIMTGIIIVAGIIFSFVLYSKIDHLISPQDRATTLNLVDLKNSLLLEAFKVDIFFCILIVAAVMVLSIVHSHRIAGPFYRVIMFARTMGDGGFSERITFRRNDVIHPIASILNEFAGAYEKREKTYSNRIAEIERNLRELDSADESSKEQAKLIDKLRELDEKLQQDIQQIKL